LGSPRGFKRGEGKNKQNRYRPAGIVRNGNASYGEEILNPSSTGEKSVFMDAETAGVRSMGQLPYGEGRGVLGTKDEHPALGGRGVISMQRAAMRFDGECFRRLYMTMTEHVSV